MRQISILKNPNSYPLTSGSIVIINNFGYTSFLGFNSYEKFKFYKDNLVSSWNEDFINSYIPLEIEKMAQQVKEAEKEEEYRNGQHNESPAPKK